MALAGGAMGIANKTNKKWGFIPAALVAVTINTALSVVMVPTMGWTNTLSLVTVPLLLAASLNVALAVTVYIAIRSRRLRI
jgi:hypothetical protein